MSEPVGRVVTFRTTRGTFTLSADTLADEALTARELGALWHRHHWTHLSYTTDEHGGRVCTWRRVRVVAVPE